MQAGAQQGTDLVVSLWDPQSPWTVIAPDHLGRPSESRVRVGSSQPEGQWSF